MYDLGRQAAQRLRMWKNELARHVSAPVGGVSFEFFTTLERLTAQEAEQMPRIPAPVGTAWGGMWEYAWFIGDAVVPEECEGRRVVLYSGVGGEQLVYANGRAIGSIDREHTYVILTRCAKAGETFHLQIESYAGHGPREETMGPCPEERPALPYPEGPQCVVGETALAVWNEDAYQLLMDVDTLDTLQQALPDNSLRALKVAQALRAFTRTADFELPHGPREESFRAARAALREALDCVNGSTAPTMWVLGQSHIDLGWLWPLEETFHKSVRTYSNQLTLMEEYPEYRFLLCEPALLDMLRERDPEVWERVKQAAARGQMTPEGVFYVECDTNIPGGESLIRQVMYGKKWFREQFGVEAQVAWQPDTFGFTAALPQILKKLNVPYFATEKLLRADPETQRFPYQNFIWEGMDGSTVEALSFFKANAPVNPLLLHKRWDTERSQRENIDTMLYTFGYGDGGGGATRDMLEMLRRAADLEGAPRTHWGDLPSFFRETSRQARENRWVGELYLAWHRGTYSVQRRQKMAMRRAEETIKETEALAALLSEAEREPVRARLDSAWKTLLLNQFHDIAGGVGIARVHREAADALNGICADLRPLNDALWRRAYGIQGEAGWTLVNPLPWPRREWVKLPDGQEVFAEMRPLGAARVQEARRELPEDQRVRARETEEGFLLQNAFFQAALDRRGRITALRTLGDSPVDFLAPGQVMNDWRLYKNTQTVYDAWEMDRDWEQGLIKDAVQARARLTRADGACGEITVEYTMGRSAATQIIRLRAGSRQLEFETEVDWHERRKLLKTHFESNVLCEDALHEIQFGYVKRPCHRSHPFARDRYEVSNHRYSALCEEKRGFALLNNGIYGLSTGRGEMALTLLRAPLVPDDTCDRGLHRFTYALLPFACAFTDARLAQAGAELNVPLRALAGGCESGWGVSCGGGILVDTVKPAEAGEGAALRLYESLGTEEEEELLLPWDAALYACGMDEGDPRLLGRGRRFRLRLRPFEIRTLLMKKLEG